MWLQFYIFISISLFCLSYVFEDIEVMQLSDFSLNGKVALHMPCDESNVFATKCMCHLKCTDSKCSNAIKLCKKYSYKRCKYVLLRSVANKKVATLKREPSPLELAQFDIAGYPKTNTELKAWNYSVTFKHETHLYSNLGMKGKYLIEELNRPINHSFCGTQKPKVDIAKDISLFALNYRAPMTLLNSMKSWNSSGLLDFVNERHIILNDPFPQEIAISQSYGFNIWEPKMIPNVELVKPNVVTINAAFYHALNLAKNEYVLFLENDFKIDVDLSRDDIQAELIAAIGLLDRGIQIVRLQSRKYKGCGTFIDCNHHKIHLDSENVMERTRNWFSFYCRDHPGSEKYVADCLLEQDFRCFTSWDSNWTLNAILVKKSDIMTVKYETSYGIKSIGELAKECYHTQDCLESSFIWMHKWMNWKVPICIAYNGLFIHEEIETGT